ncbi:MAG: MTH938/NDUFAF3 family protein [Ignavibacteria bacterium]
MKPRIDKTSFGSITINGETFEHDILIRLNGGITKRKKKLSKKYYNTSHKISAEEAEYIHEKGVSKLLIGSGQTGMVKLSEEAAALFNEKNCVVEILPTGKAIEKWNEEEGSVIGLFHLTC